MDEADTEYLDVLIDLPGDELMPADDTLITDGTSAPGRPSPDEWGGPGGQGLPGGTEADAVADRTHTRAADVDHAVGRHPPGQRHRRRGADQVRRPGPAGRRR